ncbi:MAG: glycosyltransferase family 4 protein [Candidatus Marinimicrobia bacterium]|nr:glycosyltransferase family 4 protein [Candidatus Neomarinimicrobiota bacterium]
MKNKKNLLVVLLSCWISEGGIQRVNRSILKYFSQSNSFRNISVLVLLDRPLQIEQAVHSDTLYSRCKIQGFSGGKLKFIFVYIKRILIKRPDFVWFDHVNSFPLMVSVAVLNIRYGLTIHGIEVFRPIGCLKKVALKMAKYIVCPSDSTKNEAIKYAPIFKKAMLCPWGFDVQQQNLIRNLPITLDFKDRKTILIVARMSRENAYSKGHQELIEAVKLLNKRLPEILLIIVGRGSSQPIFEKLAVEKKIQNNVLFTGFVPDEKLHVYYEHCDVFAMPSRGEGFGLVYLEAMAYGKPCIGSNLDAAKEVISDSETGYCVDPDNIEELAERLFQLLTDSELRKKMGQAGQKRYLENFTEQKFHERFMRIIGDV